MPADIQSQFDDLSGQVSRGAENVSKSMKDMVSSAVRADKAQGKLSKTQATSMEISEKFVSAMESMNTGMKSLDSGVSKTSKGFQSMSKTGASAARGVASEMAVAAGTAKTLREEVEKAGDALEQIKAPEPVQIKLDGSFFSKELRKLDDELVSLSESVKDPTAAVIVDQKVMIAQVKTLQQAIGAMDDARKQSISLKVAKNGLESAVKDLSEEHDALGIRLRKTASATDAVLNSAKSLRSEYDKATKVTDLFRSKLVEGRQEAEGFAQGLGISSGKMMAAGVAAVFLAKKVSEVIDRFRDARVSIANYNVELARMGRVVPGADASQLEEFRNTLNLTRQQAQEFYKVLREGAMSGVISVNEMVAAQQKLQQTYGGDQTDRLRTYVELLESIPTLDTDLKITTSLDDQSASLFALAREGKISAIMDLQAAGLAGGTAEALSADDTDMLNAAQKTEKTLDNIHAWLTTKLFPSWGHQFAGIAKGVATASMGIGGLIATTGGVLWMAKSNVAATLSNVKATTVGSAAIVAAIKGQTVARMMTPNIGDKAGIAKQLSGLKKTFAKSFKMSYMMRGKGAGAAIGATGKALKTTGAKAALTPSLKFLGAPMKVLGATTLKLTTAFKTLLGPVGIAGGVFLVAGKAADWLGSKLEDSGNMSAAAGARFAGATATAAGTMMTAAAAGAALGSVIPGLGTAIGGIVGALVGYGIVLTRQAGDIGGAMSDWGKSLQAPVTMMGGEIEKYGPVMQGFGRWLEKAGPTVGEFGAFVKDKGISAVKGLGKGLWDTGKLLLKWGNPIGATIAAFDKLNKSLQSEDYKEQLASMSKEAKRSAAVYKEISKQQALNAAEMQKQQQSMMKSALSLERQLGATARVAGTAKVQLADFETEVGGLAMSVVQEVGGSGRAFAKAAELSAKGISDRFSELESGLRERRRMILEDATLSAKDRGIALMDLKNEEMKATQKFVNAMSDVIKGLMDTPALIREGFKFQTKELELDFMEGFMGRDDLFDTLGKQLDSASQMYEQTSEQLIKAQEMSARRREAIESRRAAVEQDSIAAYKSLPDELQKEIAGAVSTKETEDGGMEVTGVDTDKAQKILEDLNHDMLRIQKEIDAASSVIERGAWKQVADEINGLAEEQRSINKAAKNAAKAVKDAGDDIEKQKAAKEAQMETIQRQRELEKKAADLQENMLQVTKKHVGGDKEAAKLLGEMLKSGNTAVAHTKEQAASWEKAKNAFNNMEKSERDVAMQLNKRAALVEEMGEKAKAAGVVESMVGDEINVANKEAEEELALREKVLKRAEAVVKVIRLIADEQSQEASEAQRILDTREAQMALMIQSGRAIAGIAALNQAQLDSMGKHLEDQRAAEDKLLEKKREITKQLAGINQETEKGKDEAKVISKKLEATEEALAKVKQKQAGVAEQYAGIIDGINDTLAKAMETPMAKVDQFEIDLSDATFELAEFSEVAMASANNMADAAVQAASRRRKTEEDALKQGVANAKAAAKAFVAAEEERRMRENPNLDPAVVKERSRRMLDEQYARIEAEERVRLAEIETKEKSTALKAVEAATKLQMDQLDVVRDSAQVQIDLFDTFGGTAEQLGLMLEEQLDAERGKLKALEEQAIRARQLTGDSLRTRQLELQVAQQSAKVRQDELGAVRRVLDLRRAEIDIQEQLTSAQLDFVSDFGGSLSVAMGLQQKLVGYAREQAKLAREEYDAVVARGAKGKELLEARAKMEMAELNARRRAMGVERDMLEKMLGSAFGSVRSSVGAVRQRLTQVGMMGTDRTRVVTPSGLRRSGEEGETMPYWQRQAQMRGAGGAGGADRLPLEKQMAKDMRGTEKHTQDAASSLSRGDQPGSFYTHDTTATGLLSSILAEERRIVENTDAMSKNLNVKAVLDEAKSKKTSERTSLFPDFMRHGKKEVTGYADARESDIDARLENLQSLKKEVNQAIAHHMSSGDTEEVERSRDMLKPVNDEISRLKSIMTPVQSAKKSVSSDRMPSSSSLMSPEEGASRRARVLDGLELAGQTRLGRPGNVKTIGDTFRGFRSGDRSLAGPDNIRRMGGAIDRGMSRPGDVKRMGSSRGKSPFGNAAGGAAMVNFQEGGPGGFGEARMGKTQEQIAEQRAAAQSMETGREQRSGMTQAQTQFARQPGQSTEKGVESRMTLKGEMTIHWDNAMFKKQVESVVATLITTPQIADSIKNVVFN